MSLPRDREQGNLFQVGMLFRSLFEHGDRRRFQLFHERIMPALWKFREELEGLYCRGNGRPALDPVFLAGVTLLQFMEKAPDRKAAEQTVLNLGWKCALGLPPEYEGFHPTTLVVFRKRLVEHDLERLLFDAVVGELRSQGLIRKGSKQRLDSTHIVGLVAKMSTLECVRETLRLALESLERGGHLALVPEWGLLSERYCETDLDWKEQDREKLRGKLVQAGTDACGILAWWDGYTGPLSESAQQQLELLKRVFSEQFEWENGQLQERKQKLSGTVADPHDPDAQWSTKGKDKHKKSWIGFKAQVTETVPEDPTPKPKGEPTEQFIVDVTTTEAIASDLDGMDRALENQGTHHDDQPSELFVDTAYVSDDTLHEASEAGRELVGPARSSPGHLQGFRTELFDVDNANRRAVCPAGKESTQCSLIQEQATGKVYYRYEWSYHCDTCPLQKQCTKRRSGRRELVVGRYHDFLQARRREMETEDFKVRMWQRAGIEGTNSELKRGYGMGRSRYRGLKKTHLANCCLSAACDANRWLRRLLWETDREAAVSMAV